MSNPFDAFDGEANPFDQFDGGRKPKPEKSNFLRRAVADPAISAVKGAIGIPESIVGLADLATGGRAGKAAEDLGFKPKEAKQILDTFLTPEQQEANRRVDEAEGFLPTVGAALENPSTIVHTGIESVPLMFGGAGVARGLMKAAPKASPLIAGAAGEGTIGAGLSAEGIRQETNDGLLNPEQTGIAAASGALTGLLGVGGAKVAQKLGIGDVDTLLASGKLGPASDKGMLRRVGEGMLAEGVLEELPQSVQEQVAQNIALGKPWDEGVDKAAAMGLLTGALMGGGAAIPNAAPMDDTLPPPADQGNSPLSGLLPNYPHDPMVVFPDGSTGTKSQFDQYMSGLSEQDRVSTMAKMMGYGKDPKNKNADTAGAETGNAAANDSGTAADTGTATDTRTEAEKLLMQAAQDITAGKPETEIGIPTSDTNQEVATDTTTTATTTTTTTSTAKKKRAKKETINADKQEPGAATGEAATGQETQEVTEEKAPAHDPEALRSHIVALINRKGVATNRGMVDSAVARAKSIMNGREATKADLNWFNLAIKKTKDDAKTVEVLQRISTHLGDRINAAKNSTSTEAVKDGQDVQQQAGGSEKEVDTTTVAETAATDDETGQREQAGEEVGTGGKPDAAARRFKVDSKISPHHDPISESLRARVEDVLNNDPDAYGLHDDLISLPKEDAKDNQRGSLKIHEDGRIQMLGDNGFGWGSTMTKASIEKTLKEWLKFVEKKKAKKLEGGEVTEEKEPSVQFKRYDQHIDKLVAEGVDLSKHKGVRDQIDVDDRLNDGETEILLKKWDDAAGKKPAETDESTDESTEVSQDSNQDTDKKEESETSKTDESTGESSKETSAEQTKEPEQKKPAEPGKFAKNKLFTEDKYEAAKARLRAKLATLNSGIDPEILQDGMTIAGTHIEAGVRSFVDYSKAMIEDLGEGIKPFLRSIYEAMRHYPGLDTEGMTPSSEIDSAAKEEKTEASTEESTEETTTEETTTEETEETAAEETTTTETTKDTTVKEPKEKKPKEPKEKKEKAEKKDKEPTAEKLKDVGEKMHGKRADEISKSLHDGATGNHKKDVQKIIEKATKSVVWKIDLPQGATTGTKVYLEEVRSNILGFVEYHGKRLGAGGRKYWNRTPTEAIEDRANGDMAWLEKSAGEYISMLEQLKAATSGAMSIEQARKALYDLLVADESLSGENRYTEFGKTVSKYHHKFLISDLRLEYGLASTIKEDEVSGANRAKPMVRPSLTEIKREGMKDYRNGKDVNAEDFMKTFGFRGVEFGNWVNAKERQVNVNLAYDAFYDLAETLGIKPKDISLGGKLGMAFGSRGKGRHAAHYEPSNVVINLTKTKGDGSVAHEWGHALDFALRRKGGGFSALADMNKALTQRYDRKRAISMLESILKGATTSRNGKRGITLAKDFISYLWHAQSWGGVVTTEYKKEADKLGKSYWGNKEELWAREFESFVYDKMKGDSPYLVTDWVSDSKVTKERGFKGRPYPTGEERQQFHGYFDHLISGIEWTEDGPAIKEGYELIDKVQRDSIQAELDEMGKNLAELEKRLKDGDAWPDGLWWYRYYGKDGKRGAGNQPKGYFAFDDSENAVGYPHPLDADDQREFFLMRMRSGWMPSDKAVYLKQETKDDDTVRDDGEDSLGDSQTEDGSETEGAGGLSDGAGERSGESQKDDSASGEQGGDGSGISKGDGIEGTDTSSSGGGTTNTGSGQDAVQPAGTNYRISVTDRVGEGSIGEKYNDNIAAIRTLKKIESENRLATEDEQKILVRYVGWGGMPQAFSYGYQEGWQERKREVRELLTDEEYEAARASTTNAHYTAPAVISAMWDAVKRFGFEGGRVLEPGMGIGHFFGLMPEDMLHASKLTGVELDSLTARIGKQLYQKATVINKGYEETLFPEKFFDLFISNVPFSEANHPVDKKHNRERLNLHDYYFKKSIALTRPGGIIAFITSKGTMDKVTEKARELMANDAELIGAIRLPQDAFSENANTIVTTDIIFLRRKVVGSPLQPANAWINTGKVEMEMLDNQGHQTMQPLNEYFVAHPEMMLGKMIVRGGRYGNRLETALESDGRNLADALQQAIKSMPENVMVEVTRADELEEAAVSIPADGDVKDGGFAERNGRLFVRHGELMAPVSEDTPKEKAAGQIIRSSLKLRDTIRNMLRLRVNDAEESEVAKAKKEIEKVYKEFVKKHGYVNDAKNVEAFAEDPDAALVLAIEKWDADKERGERVEIDFKKRQPVEHTDSVQDALIVSLNEKGRVDWNTITRLTGKSENDAKNELKGLVYDDPTQGWVTAEEYLSGNVREKLEIARGAAKADPAFEDNVTALEAALPVDLPPSKINARTGSTWIPGEDVSLFMTEMLGVNASRLIVTFLPEVGKWVISPRPSSSDAATAREFKSLKQRSEARVTWGTRFVNFIDLMEYALNGGFPVVNNPKDLEGKVTVNKKATVAANAKLIEIKERFSRWVWEDPERSVRLARKYNDEMNNIRLQEYKYPANPDQVNAKGQISLPGMAIGMALNPHQAAAVWRTVQSGNVYYAHEVGTGKTFTMTAAGMELKRLGLAKKPMFAVLNSTIGQFKAEFLRLYPGANILAMNISEDKVARKRQLARIAVNNWDAVIITHESFAKIPMSQAAIQENFQREINNLAEAILAARADNMTARVVKELENSKKALENKMKKALEKREKDDVLTFEELGVDQIFIDEAQEHKNLMFSTRMGRQMRGLNPEGSGRAFDLYMKTNWLNDRYGRGVALASGTSISNSVGELFTISRYLQPSELARRGIQMFDAWANTFGDIGQVAEYKPEGGGYQMVTKFNRFVNIPELMQMVYTVMDAVSADKAKIKRPAIAGGKFSVVLVPQSEQFKAYQQIINDRALAIRQDPRGSLPDNMLAVVSDGRKAAMDMRMVMPEAKDNPDTKTNRAVTEILAIYKREMEKKGTQLVFADIGVPGTKNFSVYDDLKNKLVKAGIPAEEIAFVHDAKDDRARKAQFAKVNSGKIRVWMASTKKGGTGVNVQERTAAIHNLDPHWNLANILQRIGRGQRQGNIYDEIEILNYATEASVDTFMWDKVQSKGRFIDQIMSGDVTLREAEDISQETMSAAEMVALASGDPMIAEKVELEATIQKLSYQYSAHEDQIMAVRQELAIAPQRIRALQEEAKHAKAEAAAMATVKKGKTDGKEFDLEDEDSRKAFSQAIVKKVGIHHRAIEDKMKPNMAWSEQRALHEGTTVIGSLIGDKAEFTLLAQYPMHGGDTILVRGRHGDRDIDPESGITSQTVNALEKRYLKTVDERKAEIARIEGEIPKLKVEAAKKFAKFDELDAKRKRLDEIESVLTKRENTQNTGEEDQSENFRFTRKDDKILVVTKFTDLSFPEFPGVKFFAYRNGETVHIIHAQSGLSFASGSSIEAARTRANELISTHGVENITSLMANAGVLSDDQKEDAIADAAENGAKFSRILTKRVFHGTAHVWAPEPGFPHGRPRLDKMGTGEGAQVYGWGWYSAENPGVADSYRETLSETKMIVDGKEINHSDPMHIAAGQVAFDGNKEAAIANLRKEAGAGYNDAKQKAIFEKAISIIESGVKLPSIERTAGSLYQLDIPDASLPYLMDWDKPLSEQTPQVRKALEDALLDYQQKRSVSDRYMNDNFGGANVSEIYQELASQRGAQGASEYLASIGIVGNRYLDGMSRARGQGTYNYVIWDQATLDKIAMLERNGAKLDAIREAEAIEKRQSQPSSEKPQAFDLASAIAPLQGAGIKKIKIAKTSDDLPDAARRKFSEVGGGVRGMYLPDADEIWLIEDQIKDAEEAIFVALHEATHRGLAKVFGEDLSPILRQIWATNVGVKRETAEMMREFPDMSREEAIEEVLADMARRAVARKLNGWKKLVAFINKWLSDMGFLDIRFTDEMVEELVAGAAKAGLDDTTGGGNSGIRTKRSGKESQIDTPAFKRWFGNSKVVDENGKPLVVYHGTDASFDIFDTSKSRPGAAFGPGIYLTEDRTNTNWKGGEGSNVMPVFVKVENPLDIRKELTDKEADALAAIGLTVRVDDGHRYAPLISMERRFGSIGEAAKAAGFDGLLHYGPNGQRHILIFDNKNIKSATGNNGNFDPTNPDIRTSRARTKQSAPASKYAELNRKFREQDRTAWDKAKKWLKRQLSPGGLLPAQVFDEKIRRDSEFEAVEFDISHLVGQLERAIKKDYGIDAHDADAKLQQLMSDVMAGKSTSGVPDATKTALLGMRQYIDGLSIQYLDALEAQAKDLIDQAGRTGDQRLIAEAESRMELYQVIMGNVGQYVHRSYRAFDDKNWARTIPDAVLDNAREYLIDQGLTEERAEVVMNEIVKHGTAYDNLESFIKESKLGAKDLSVLKKRKEIAPEIRALLGEYTDPRINFAKSATKMGRLIWNQKFLEKVREIGMGNFLFTDKDKPAEATAKIAADKSEAYAPLNGLWTYPETDQAFRDALGKEQMEDWYRAIVRANGMVKYGKTVLSPTTAMRNWMSAFFFTVANGHFDLTHMQKSIDGLREYFTHNGEAKKLAYLRKLKQLGVVYDTPYAGEMMRLLADSELADNLTLTKGKLKIKNALGLATKFYSFGDDFWKIIGFENEKRMWMKSGLSEAQAEQKAAQRIRDTYPTYSMVGRGIQSLRRFPLAGTFVSFPAEIIRTSINMVRYLSQDYKNPKTRAMAQRRAAGMAIASSFAFAAQALSMAAMGFDDDDEEALRLMAAPWQRNSNLLVTGYDDDGNVRYLDMSFLDPYNYWKRPITAVMRGQDADKAIADVFKETLTPFLGVDIAAGSIFEILANKKETGAPVFQEHDETLNQMSDIANHLRKALQPGILTNLERTYKAIDGEVSPSGRKYDIEDEAAAWFGFRVSTQDAKVALYYRSFDFKDTKAQSDKGLRSLIRSQNEVDSDDLRGALETTNSLREETYREMHVLIKAAERSGMTRAQIMSVLKSGGVSMEDIQALLKGDTPEWKPNMASAKKMATQARSISGQEGYRRIMDRYRELSRM